MLNYIVQVNIYLSVKVSLHVVAPKYLNSRYIYTCFCFVVKSNFTNHQYHELKNEDKLEYEVRRENSIFFEVL